MGLPVTRAACMLLLAALLAPPEARSGEAPPAGQAIERLACDQDPDQTYALYLPADYTPDRRWPLLIAMDPRGRALIPLHLFRDSAERRGWILMSSWNTRSDGAGEPNEAAMRAMLPEAQRRFSIDTRRIYLAGFSGTARVAWDIAYRLEGHVAGIVGFGAGLPFALEALRRGPFAFFGGSGTADFNYEEMRALDERLEGIGMPHRFEPFEGPHAWGPEELCSEALDWMEIQAMRAGVRDRSDALIEEIYARRLERADALAIEPRPYEAFLAYRALARDFAGLREVAGPAERAGALARSRPVRRAVARGRRLAARQAAYEARLGAFFGQCHERGGPPPLRRALADLRIASLRRTAADDRDPIAAGAARRLLELVFVHTSFYEPRGFLEKGDSEGALALLRVAAEIKPDDPRVLLGQARAYALAGQMEKALEALRGAAAMGLSDPSAIEADPAFETLRGEPAYGEILERLGGKARP